MKKGIKYFVTVGCGLAIFLMVAVSKKIFTQTEAAVIYQILSDSFFVSGVAITGLGLLLYASCEGVFDGLSYGFKVLFLTFKGNPHPVKQTYYDYKEEKRIGRLSFAYLIICGVVFLLPAFIFSILFTFN